MPSPWALVLAALAVAATTTRAQSPGRDTTCAPCRDFYQYANGGWLETVVISPDHFATGTFYDLVDQSTETIRDLLAAAPAEAKAGRFYAACMDSARADADGAGPLDAELHRIDAIATKDDLRSEIARLHRIGVGAVFTFVAAQDAKHSSQVIGDASQGGIGLPDRDYYFRSDSVSARTRDRYRAHIERVLELTGLVPADARTKVSRVMALETALARASMTITERENPQALYHRMTVPDLARLTPTWLWPAYLKALGRADVPLVNVQQPAFFRAVDHLLDTSPLDDWKTYLRWQYASTAAPTLDTAFVNEDFRFNALLSGRTQIVPRWKRCITLTDALLGDEVGRLYVARRFAGDAKPKALAMVRNLEVALDDDLRTLAWMSVPTRREARRKLAAFINKIGYPDHWRDYSALALAEGPFWADVTAATAFETDRQLAKIGRPFDHADWTLTPATVNAEYSDTRNDVTFPAAILQPPAFDPTADLASNYGGIGAVIGHEMTHGFDDQGRQSDADGNLRDWWTTDDAAKYNARAQRLVDQYDRFVMIDTLHLNGRQTLSENIADLGGLKIAYAAMEHALTEDPSARRVIDGMTPEQRFFLAYARIWRERVRPERVRLLVQTDVHSPGRVRVVGALANMPEFAAAWHCHAGDTMVRPDSLRGQIW